MRILAFALLSLATVLAQPVKRDPLRHYYALHFPQEHPHTTTHAQSIANSLGVRYEGPVGELQTYFLVSAPITSNLSKRDTNDPTVEAFWAHKQKRSLMARDEIRSSAWDAVKSIDKQVLKRLHKRGPIPGWDKRAPVKLKGPEILADAQKSLHITDPGFPQQWHLVNQQYPGKDINVVDVWKQGVTGNGSTVVILDDGLDYESQDLAANFFAEGSYDFNDHTPFPKPRLWDDSHGTRCAGQIAAVKNDVCGIGIAYNSRVAGVRILSGDITDADEAAALNYKYQDNDIYSCSWGPSDDGEKMEAPVGMLADAFQNGVKNGRGGKGSVFVFATGNGAASGDNCNFDGYTNSIYTITVGAIDHTDNHPPYSESCSAQLVVTYSSGGGEYIYTTNVGTSVCTNSHSGTSAAAPNAAGIFALVLGVRPDLTWRDMQHLCVQTAEPIQLEDKDWKRLPSGRIYNHKFGYGRLNTLALIEAARAFESVNIQTHLELSVILNKAAIPDSSGAKHRVALKSAITVTEEMIKAAGLLRLEHVTATVDIEHQQRGNIVINLQSPHMVESELATERPRDLSPDGIRDWKFMSVKHWDENPVGDWTLLVYDVSHPEMTGNLLKWTLTLFGEMDPEFTGNPVYKPEEVPVVKPTSVVIKPTAPTSDSTTVAVAPSVVTEPSRPTRIKANPSKSLSLASSVGSASASGSAPSNSHIESTTKAAASETNSVPLNGPSGKDGQYTNADEEEQVKNEGDSGKKTNDTVDIIIYAVVGSATILGIATAIFIFKRNHGKTAPILPPSSSGTARSSQPDDYEFSMLRPDDDEDDEDEDNSTTDGRPLLGSGGRDHRSPGH